MTFLLLISDWKYTQRELMSLKAVPSTKPRNKNSSKKKEKMITVQFHVNQLQMKMNQDNFISSS